MLQQQLAPGYIIQLTAMSASDMLVFSLPISFTILELTISELFLMHNEFEKTKIKNYKYNT
jgi:hypothetical protein